MRIMFKTILSLTVVQRFNQWAFRSRGLEGYINFVLSDKLHSISIHISETHSKMTGRGKGGKRSKSLGFVDLNCGGC